MSVIITGASGLLGRQIYSRFKQNPELTVVGLAYSRCGNDLLKVDLTNEKQLEDVITEHKPTVIIHSAAERRPDVVDNKPDQTEALNVGATQSIAQLAVKHGAYVVYLSTDYVFDGENPPYKETDKPNPLNSYGKTKLHGEKKILDASKDNIVLRVPVLYGPCEFVSESAVSHIWNQVKNTEKSQKVDNFAQRYPTNTIDVAKVIYDLVQLKKQNLSVCGIYHWSDTQRMTKYEMATAMAQTFNVSADHLQADDHPPQGVPRPRDSALDSQQLRTLLGVEYSTPFSEGIRNAIEKYM